MVHKTMRTYATVCLCWEMGVSGHDVNINSFIDPPDLGVGGFKYFLFSPLFGEDSHFDEYFSDGLKPPTSDIYF